MAKTAKRRNLLVRTWHKHVEGAVFMASPNKFPDELVKFQRNAKA